MDLFNLIELKALKFEGAIAFIIDSEDPIINELLKISNDRKDFYLILNIQSNQKYNYIENVNVLYFDFTNIDFLYILKEKYKIKTVINIFNLFTQIKTKIHNIQTINYNQFYLLNTLLKEVQFNLVDIDFNSLSFKNNNFLKKDKLSAIITIYNESLCIPIMYERLTKVFCKLAVNYEIIFINGASSDNSQQVLEQLVDSDYHVIALETSRSFGNQSSFLCGMENSTGDAVILLDGDLQDPPELIEKFYEKWKSGFEVVYGKREKRAGNPIMLNCYKIFYRIFKTMSYISIPKDAGDFSLMDRKVVNELIKLSETDFMIRGLRAWVGFKQTAVNYFRPERIYGKSNANYISNFRVAKKIIFSFSFLPLEVLTYLGISFTFISFIALFVQVYFYLKNPILYQIGLNTVICLILIFGGLIMLSIAILGEYQAKILEETKKRPKFILNKIYKNKYENE